VRAKQTAEIAGQALSVAWQTDDRLRPGAALRHLQMLLASGQCQRIMLVGHEPDLSAIIGQLTGGRVKMRTAGCARVDLERVEPGAGVLVWLASPDMLALPAAAGFPKTGVPSPLGTDAVSQPGSRAIRRSSRE
jgi:phosphohistidine phosphatase SixA